MDLRIFFGLVLVLLVAFAWKYRYREGQPVLDAPKHNTALELTWTFIPTLIVIVIFFYGFKGYLHMVVPPPDSYEVDVTAHMWDYTFSYPNGGISDDTNMHIPVDTPVVFVLTSTDVIHGFYMPVFRIKKDVVPGAITRSGCRPRWWEHSTFSARNIAGRTTQRCGGRSSCRVARIS